MAFNLSDSDLMNEMQRRQELRNQIGMESNQPEWLNQIQPSQDQLAMSQGDPVEGQDYPLDANVNDPNKATSSLNSSTPVGVSQKKQIMNNSDAALNNMVNNIGSDPNQTVDTNYSKAMQTMGYDPNDKKTGNWMTDKPIVSTLMLALLAGGINAALGDPMRSTGQNFMGGALTGALGGLTANAAARQAWSQNANRNKVALVESKAKAYATQPHTDAGTIALLNGANKTGTETGSILGTQDTQSNILNFIGANGYQNPDGSTSMMDKNTFESIVKANGAGKLGQFFEKLLPREQQAANQAYGSGFDSYAGGAGRNQIKYSPSSNSPQQPEGSFVNTPTQPTQTTQTQQQDGMHPATNVLQGGARTVIQPAQSTPMLYGVDQSVLGSAYNNALDNRVSSANTGANHGQQYRHNRVVEGQNQQKIGIMASVAASGNAKRSADMALNERKFALSKEVIDGKRLTTDQANIATEYESVMNGTHPYLNKKVDEAIKSGKIKKEDRDAYKETLQVQFGDALKGKYRLTGHEMPYSVLHPNQKALDLMQNYNDVYNDGNDIINTMNSNFE